MLLLDLLFETLSNRNSCYISVLCRRKLFRESARPATFGLSSSNLRLDFE